MLELRPMAVVMSALRIAQLVAALLGMNRRTLWADERALHFASIDAIARFARRLILSRINGLAEMEILLCKTVRRALSDLTGAWVGTVLDKELKKIW